jgi:hypothetical protein
MLTPLQIARMVMEEVGTTAALVLAGDIMDFVDAYQLRGIERKISSARKSLGRWAHLPGRPRHRFYESMLESLQAERVRADDHLSVLLRSAWEMIQTAKNLPIPAQPANPPPVGIVRPWE